MNHRALPAITLEASFGLAAWCGQPQSMGAAHRHDDVELNCALAVVVGGRCCVRICAWSRVEGSAVYSTLEAPPVRHLTLEGQRYIAGPHGERLLFPLVFCRECGQHYALCAYDPEAEAVTPRQPMSRGEDVSEPALAGYLLTGEDAWSEGSEELLPDSWFNLTRSGRTIKKDFRPFVPRRLHVLPDGAVVHHRDTKAQRPEGSEPFKAWPAP